MEKTTCLIEPSEISRAAALIRSGELVAFPTETVYGLGANALNEASHRENLRGQGPSCGQSSDRSCGFHRHGARLGAGVAGTGGAIGGAFLAWSLTLVLKKQSHVPDRLTAGLDTVGIRMPSNPIALALIREAEVPIAAPSANRFTELSPTTAAHVRESLGDRVAMVLDGGRTTVGIESSVLSLAGGGAVLLRPGMLTQADIEAVIGPVQTAGTPASGGHASPGLHPRHYSPRTKLVLIENGSLPSSAAGHTCGFERQRRPIAWFACLTMLASTRPCCTRRCTKPTPRGGIGLR